MRVALDVTHAELNRTGVGRYPAELAAALPAGGEVDLVALAEPVTAMARRARRVARGLWREGTYYPVRLSARARRRRAEVLHCPTLSPVRGGGLPLVVTIHDLLPMRMPELFTPGVRAHARSSAACAARATRVLTNSEWTRGEVIDLLGLAPERVVATPFGLGARFSPREPDRDRLRERFGITGRYVLSVGTREPRKNLVSVIRAYQRLASELPDVQLALVGGAERLGEELDAALGSAGEGVRVCGFVDDDELVELYRGAACFAFASLAEGFGFPPLEAMACGTPVVAGGAGAVPEIVGDAGILTDDLAAGLDRLLGDPELRATLRERGLARAAQFTWEACAEGYATAYREAAA